MRANSDDIWVMEEVLVSMGVDASDGFLESSISGQLASEVRKSQGRIRTAPKNSGFRFPAKKITVDLSSADIRKDDTVYDPPIMVIILGTFQMVGTDALEDGIVVEELGLDDRVKPVSGVLPLATMARGKGVRRYFLSLENVEEDLVMEGVDMVRVKFLGCMVGIPRDVVSVESCHAPPYRLGCRRQKRDGPDYREVNDQTILRRVAEVAAAGMHGLLLTGSARAGRTMIARRIPTVLPGLTQEENIEMSGIYNICRLLPPDRPPLSERLLRSPHHTITARVLTDGGAPPRPGELSLASGDVLFLDELPHFGRLAVKILGQPSEEWRIIVTRVPGNYELPADFMMVTAMNLYPYGFYPDGNHCNRAENQIRRYLGHTSGPMLEQFGIRVQAAPVTFGELNLAQGEGEGSASVQKRMKQVKTRQEHRFSGVRIHFNSRMGTKEVERRCCLGSEEEASAQRIYESEDFSARRYHKVLKVVRTVADPEDSEDIKKEYLVEVLGYDGPEEKIRE